MKILCLQHAEVEHPGKFRDFLIEDGHSWDAIELDQGEPLPANTDGYDALWVLGGPMDVWQEDQHPWLKAEKAFIRDAVVEKGVPFLGLCLGHQLLAEVLGGKVGQAKQPEIGVLAVSLTQAGLDDVFFDCLDETFNALQWHSAEVTALPQECRVLASSSACTVQAFGWSKCAYAVQFHLEVEADTIENWNNIPQYRDALVGALGQDGAEELKLSCAKHQRKFEANAERVYINWMQSVVKATGIAR